MQFVQVALDAAAGVVEYFPTPQFKHVSAELAPSCDE
jgi:hypothetical protein